MNHFLNKINTLGLLLVFCIMAPGYVQAGSDSISDSNAQRPLIFGFLPILSTQKLLARFGPLTDYLSEQIGRPVRFETAPDFTEFLKRTNEEKRYDLIFTAPHFYYLAQREAGYRVLVRVDAPEMHAIIVVPKDSGLTSIHDLRNKRLSTVDPLSLATVLVRAELKKAGVDPDRDIELIATPTHNASLLSAYKKTTDAASLMTLPYKRANPIITDQMQVIARTQGTPHMPIAVAPRISEREVSIVQESLLELKDTEEGRALLKHLSWPGFAAATPEEYDQLEWVVQQIRIE